MACQHWESSGIVFFAMVLLDDWCMCGWGGGVLLVRLTCHIITATLLWHSKTSLPCLATFMSFDMNVAVNPSYYIWMNDIKDPDWRWGDV